MQAGDHLISSFSPSTHDTGDPASNRASLDERRVALLAWGAAQNYPQHWFLDYLAIAAGEQHWLTFVRSATDEKIGQALEATKLFFSLPARNRH